VRRIPVVQVQQHAREEAGLGRAQQEAQDVEHRVHFQPGGPRQRLDEGHRAGDQAPGHHDARDPASRAEALEREIARHFEQEIAEKENACAEAIRARRQADILIHRQSGEADVHAIEERDEVQQAQERQQPQRGLANDGAFFD